MVDDMIALRRAVDRLLAEDLDPLLELLAEDVEFEVAGGGDLPDPASGSGRQAVVDYFSALGGLVAFWQIDYGATGGQVIAWGKESFTLDRSGLDGGCEFALVFDLADGMITRLVVIEDLLRAGPVAPHRAGRDIAGGRGRRALAPSFPPHSRA
jgi:ketosteroid isomerase-like protein